MADAFETEWSGVGVGGSLALDFVNTLDWRLRAEPVELLVTVADCARWARSAGVLQPAQARALRVWAAAHPGKAARSLAAAIDVREAIAALFQAAARGEALPERPLRRLEAAVQRAWAERSLRPAGRAAAWGWSARTAPSDRPALAAALDAARLLTSADLGRVRECGDGLCGWLFLDTSRNCRRRWCSMKGCGNRNKARSFYRRAKKRAARSQT